MKEEFKPSSDFVSRVMDHIYEYEASKFSFTEWLMMHPSIRYALAGGGAIFGIFKTVSAF
jgi:hypothetical protein